MMQMILKVLEERKISQQSDPKKRRYLKKLLRRKEDVAANIMVLKTNSAVIYGVPRRVQGRVEIFATGQMGAYFIPRINRASGNTIY
jgi:hypothetical protein